eukprot:m51a1_g14362 Golgi microtubule-associated protein 210 (675) ;mRNA; r:218011-225953
MNEGCIEDFNPPVSVKLFLGELAEDGSSSGAVASVKSMRRGESNWMGSSMIECFKEDKRCLSQADCHTDPRDASVVLSPRIVNGDPVQSPSKFPWAASLMWPSTLTGIVSTMCGGTLVAPTWVLTAGHCLDQGTLAHGFPPGLHVVVGSLAPSTEADPAKSHTVARALTHPDFSIYTMDNDVALIKLKEPVRDVEPVALASADAADLSAGTKVWALGWGNLYYASSLRPPSLMQVKLPIVDRAQCSDLLGSLIPNFTLCTGYSEGGRDSCQGDSGGPLLRVDEEGRAVQVGITSWGSGCASSGSPGVWTRVSSFRRWIDETMAAVDRGDKVCGCPTKRVGDGRCNMLCYSEECQWDGGDCNNTHCGAGCTVEMLANNVCDAQCATESCMYDNYACHGLCGERCLNSMVNNTHCDTACLTSECQYDGNDCLAHFCDPRCPNTLVGNSVCNPECYNEKCGHDGGDCDVFNDSCALLCNDEQVGDGVCNPACNVSQCHYDGGDCVKFAKCRGPIENVGNGYCDKLLNTKECNFDNGMCDKMVGEGYCSPNCRTSQLGNRRCEKACFTAACGWDRGDCDRFDCNGVTGHCLQPAWPNDGYCQPECNIAACKFDGGDCFDVRTTPHCAPGCFPHIHRHNGVCEPECMNAACDYDAPDCQSLFGCAPFCLSSWIHDGQCDT